MKFLGVLFAAASTALLLITLVSVFKPKIVGFWIKDKSRATKQKVGTTYLISWIVCVIMFAFCAINDTPENYTASSSQVPDTEPVSENEIYTATYNVIDSTITGYGEDLSLQVRLSRRVTSDELNSISSDLRHQKSQRKRVVISYHLPGQKKGVGTLYARSFYPSDDSVRKYTKQRDLYNEPVEHFINGLSSELAIKLLSFNPPNMQYKMILGRFIDDSWEKCTVVYTDTRERKGYAFIADFYKDGKMHPIISTPIVKFKGGLKFITDIEGGYFTIIDSVLTKYAHDEEGKPYQSIKSNI